MCEYCGCRDNPEIAKLGAEHDAIVNLANDQMARDLSSLAVGSRA